MKNPVDDKKKSSIRVVRGGDWFNTPNILRSARRTGGTPSYRYGSIGFRMVRSKKNEKSSK